MALKHWQWSWPFKFTRVGDIHDSAMSLALACVFYHLAKQYKQKEHFSTQTADWPTGTWLK